MRIGGSFHGTGSTLYLCIGFVPDWVHLWNTEATTPIEIVWNKHMAAQSATPEGFIFSWNSTFSSSDAEQLAKGAGITTLFGGTTLASADVGTTTYGSTSAVYLKPDYHDYRFVAADSPTGIGDAVAVTIDTWTLYSASNFTGHFNEDVTGTYIGPSSPIQIDGKWYSILTLSAGTGEATNEVLLTHNVPSGEVQYIGGMWTTKPMIAGEVTKDGFVVYDTTCNASGERVVFEAGTYDM